MGARSTTVTEKPCLISQYARTGPATLAPEMRIRMSLPPRHGSVSSTVARMPAGGLNECSSHPKLTKRTDLVSSSDSIVFTRL
ncbi:unnamed protein product [[Actinomadura] parvosata subsp. kistnae]|nr:unnamed protein product [Actinomadura parvosata subsp. kistnae]